MNGLNKEKIPKFVPPEQIMYNMQKNSEYNNRTKKKKRGLFKKKEQKPDVPTSTTSETLWREINLFLPETIAIVGAAIAGIILMFIVRFMSATGLELIKDMLTDQAYIEVAGLISNINTLFLGVAAIPFLVLIGFYAYRLFVFTPRRGKYLVARIKSTGAVKLSVDKIKDEKIEFEKGIAKAMQITNPKKHWVETTGKPMIYLFEGDDSNADLNVINGNVSGKSVEVNTVNENAISYGRRIEKYIQEQGGDFLTPTNIILILILGGVGLALFFLLKNPETTAQLLQGPVAFSLGGLF